MYILHVNICRGEMARFQVRGPMAHVMVSWVLQLADSQDILEVRKAQVHVRVQELANISAHIRTWQSENLGCKRLHAYTHEHTPTDARTQTHTHTHT